MVSVITNHGNGDSDSDARRQCNDDHSAQETTECNHIRQSDTEQTAGSYDAAYIDRHLDVTSQQTRYTPQQKRGEMPGEKQ